MTFELQVQRNPIADGWSYAEPREDDLPPEHELDAWIKERLSALQAEAEAARSEEAALSAEVDRIRGDVALGIADRRGLLAASKRLARAQNRVGDAESAIRAGQRLEARERRAYLEAQRARSRSAYEEATAAKRELATRTAAVIRAFIAEVDRIEAAVATLNAAYRNPRIEYVMQPPFGAMRDELDRRARNLEGAAQ